MIDHNFYASPVQASQTLITHILEAMDKELERPFTIALSGGTTPATLFEVWEREYAAYTPWSRIYFYWVDERCVPPGDDQSNFGLAYRLLFSKVGIPASHYYRIVGEGAPEEEAKQYSSIVKTTVPTVDGVPVFDFVLLGIGEDGHTSSIFPLRLLHPGVPEGPAALLLRRDDHGQVRRPAARLLPLRQGRGGLPRLLPEHQP